MKTKKGFVLRNVCGENIIVAEGKDFDPDTLKNLLMKEYEVEETTADADAKTIAKQWIEAGIAE